MDGGELNLRTLFPLEEISGAGLAAKPGIVPANFCCTLRRMLPVPIASRAG